MKGKILALIAGLMLVFGMVLVSCNPDDGDGPSIEDMGKDGIPTFLGGDSDRTGSLNKFLDDPTTIYDAAASH